VVPCDAASPQHAWLVADLAAHPNACTLAYFHHPRFQDGAMYGDVKAVAPLWDALYDAGADVVLNGHEHNYQQLGPMDKTGAPDPARGMRVFVVGTGGAVDFYGQFTGVHAASVETHVVNTNGVLELALRPDGYDWRFVAVDGSVPAGASGSGRCH
jgi:hypothetical protein